MSFVIDREVLRVSGGDATRFLGDLISNNLPAPGEIQYAALLSPQGKYLFDFFVIAEEGAYLIDVDRAEAAALSMRLTMYKLRADVQIENSDLKLSVGQGDVPTGAFLDPRDARLGWRAYGDAATDGGVDWNAEYVAHVIPRTGVELISDKSYLLEAGFERLNGVDFKKGCYVGQEVTARMKHKTELNKGVIGVNVSAEMPVGTPITREGKGIGTLYSQAGGQGIAHLRFAQIGADMMAGEARVSLREDAL